MATNNENKDRFPPGYRTKKAKEARALAQQGVTLQAIATQLGIPVEDVHYATIPRGQAWEVWEQRQADVVRRQRELVHEAKQAAGTATAAHAGQERLDTGAKVYVLPSGKVKTHVKSGPLPEEIKHAILEAYEANPEMSLPEIARGLNVNASTAAGVVARAPGVQRRVSAKREALTISHLESTILHMASQLSQQVQRGGIQPHSNNMRDYAVMLGILTDKRQLLTGGATSRTGEEAPETFKEKRARMLAVVEKAEATVKQATRMKKLSLP